jgi:hypothetical protein
MKTAVVAASRTVARISLSLVLIAVSGDVAAQGSNQNGWASETDPVARQLIEQERKWATLSCVPSSTIVAYGTAFIGDFIADDFVGTSPKGNLYNKSDILVTSLPKGWEPERDCKLLGAKVRFVGPNVAVIYGSESAAAKGSDGQYSTRTLIWTDTLLFRSGKWQVVAVQDMTKPKK